ncbi:MAG: RloB family protein [Acidobacteriota bacterium]
MDRTIPHLRDTRLCVIATEGEYTEKLYFSMFRNPRIQVKVLPAEDGRSAPEYVLDRLELFAEEFQIGDEDELWVMLDVDRWGDSKLNAISARTIRKGYGLAVSNPCFEIWLYLHFLDVGSQRLSCQKVIALLRKHLGGYRKTNLDVEIYRPLIPDAIRRAKELHSNPNERWPSTTGTHVYRIVEKLI